MAEGTEKKVYTAKEIAEILEMSVNGVYRIMRSGSPPFKVLKVGSTYRVLKKSFDEWLENS